MLAHMMLRTAPISGRMIGLILAFALAACSSNGDSSGGSDSASETPAPITSASATGTAAAPTDFTGTAWRSEGADGARYTTYIDAQGRYRDWRDGQPWEEGAWEMGNDGALCFTPDGDNVLRRCWQPDSLSEAGTMVVTGEDGQRVEVAQVDYIAPTPAPAATGSPHHTRKK